MKRLQVGWAAFALAGTLSLTAPAQAETVEITASALNVRSGPSTRYSRVGLAYEGDKVEVVGRSGDWVKVKKGSSTGWVHSSYIRAVTGSAVGASGRVEDLTGGTSTAAATAATPTAPSGSDLGSALQQVVASALRLRSGPSTDNRTLDMLPFGTNVNVLGSQGDWRKVQFNGQTGWVHSAFLQPSNGNGTGTGTDSGTSTPIDLGSASRNWKIPNDGRQKSGAGFVQLKASGPGFYAYYRAEARWGKPRMVYGLERCGMHWATNRRPRMGVGDISLKGGGKISGHASHQKGVDADLRAMRDDGQEGRAVVGEAHYNSDMTKELLQLIRKVLPVTNLFFNDPKTIRAGLSTHWPNHYNHFHVRISG